MKTLGMLFTLGGKDNLGPTLTTATNKLNTMGNSVKKLDKEVSITTAKIKALGQGLQEWSAKGIAIGAGLGAAIGGTVMQYQNLAKAQGEIASLGIDDTGIATITKSAMEFSNQFAGANAADIVRASYDIKSGISSLTDEGVASFTKLAAMTATATKATTADMTKLFALGHGIFKDGSESDFEFGNRMSSQIALAVKAFRTDGTDLIGGIANIGAMAKKMGVTLSEELAIIGNAKGSFDSASEAATGYRSFLENVGKAQEKLGLQFTDSEGKMLPMVNILEQMKQKYGDSIGTVAIQDEIKNAFGSAEAVKIINALIDKTDALKQSQMDLNNATLDNVEAMAKSMNKGREFELLQQQLGNATSLIGKAFAPTVLSLSNAIGGVVSKVQVWMNENETLAGAIGSVLAVGTGLITTVGAIGLGVGGFLTILPTVTTGLLAVGGAIKFISAAFLTNPIGLAITAIAAGAFLIYKNWEPIKGFFLDIFNEIKKGFNWIGESFNKIKSIGSSVKGFFGFGEDEEENKEIPTIGSGINQATASTKAMYPNVAKETPVSNRQISQNNNIQIAVHNPTSNVDVQNSVIAAMSDNRSLSDNF